MALITWADLADLRRQGLKPAFKVIVASKMNLPPQLSTLNAVVIHHEAGQAPPINLLEGLEVIAWFANCELAGKFFNWATRKGVKFASYSAWCGCGGNLTSVAFDCNSYLDLHEWLDRQRKVAA